MESTYGTKDLHHAIGVRAAVGFYGLRPHCVSYGDGKDEQVAALFVVTNRTTKSNNENESHAYYRVDP